jgi:hypothetical protein
MRQLRDARAFWDAETGESWDLLFAGYQPYRAYTESEVETRFPHNSGHWWFDPEKFLRLAEKISEEQNVALLSVDGSADRWRYSGKVDLVSFMAYGGEPDWCSLKSVCLTDSRGEYRDGHSVDEVIVSLRHWQNEDIADIFAPSSPYRGAYVTSTALESALQWSASAVVGGVLGNAVYDLVNRITW